MACLPFLFALSFAEMEALMTLTRRNLIAMTLAAAALPAGAMAKARTPIPVILYTDIGGDVDDTWALLTLLRHPQLDLKLVVTETGNALYRCRLTAKLLALAGRDDVPVAGTGDKGDGTGPQSAWVGDFSADTYRGGVSFDGVTAMIDAVHSSPEPVTIIALGPVTALADALRRTPAMAKNARFLGMEGSVRIGYGGAPKPEVEYNVKTDPAALATVFAAGWTCTITPLDTCGLMVLDGADMQAIVASSDPFARACIANSQAWLPNAPWMPKDFDLTKKSSTLFDVVAVMMALDESDLVMETLRLSVRPDGMTVIDPAGRKVRVATAWKNLPRFKSKVVAALTAKPA